MIWGDPIAAQTPCRYNVLTTDDGLEFESTSEKVFFVNVTTCVMYCLGFDVCLAKRFFSVAEISLRLWLCQSHKSYCQKTGESKDDLDRYSERDWSNG